LAKLEQLHSDLSKLEVLHQILAKSKTSGKKRNLSKQFLHRNI